MNVLTILITSILFFSLFSVNVSAPNNNNENETQNEPQYETQAYWHNQYVVCNVYDLKNVTGFDYIRCKPQTLYKNPNGSLICLIQGGQADDRYDIFRIDSYNDGLNWSLPKLFYKGCYTLGFGPGIGHSVKVAVNYTSGRIWLNCASYLGSSRYMYMIYSDDNSVNWYGLNASHCITTDAICLNDMCNWTQPQMEFIWHEGDGRGLHNGRVIFPFINYSRGQSDSAYDLFQLYSANPEQGLNSTWVECTSVYTGNRDNENTYVQLQNLSMYATIRSNKVTRYCYWITNVSAEDIVHTGITYSTGIPDSVSKGVVLRYTKNFTTPDIPDGAIQAEKNRVLMCWNNHTGSPRINLTVAVSYDECKTWRYSKEIELAGLVENEYPTMTFTDNNSIVVMAHPCNGVNGAEDRKFAWLMEFSLEWLTDGEDTVNRTFETLQFISINDGTNGTTITTQTPTFNWTIITNTAHYKLQVANDSAFTQLVVDLNYINEINYPTEYTETTNVSFILPTANQLTDFKKYYCRVRVYN